MKNASFISLILPALILSGCNEKKEDLGIKACSEALKAVASESAKNGTIIDDQISDFKIDGETILFKTKVSKKDDTQYLNGTCIFTTEFSPDNTHYDLGGFALGNYLVYLTPDVAPSGKPNNTLDSIWNYAISYTLQKNNLLSINPKNTALTSGEKKR